MTETEALNDPAPAAESTPQATDGLADDEGPIPTFRPVTLDASGRVVVTGFERRAAFP